MASPTTTNRSADRPDRAPIDATDRRIVALLQEDARRSLSDVGRRVGLSPPAVKRRLDRLRSEGVVVGYTAVVGAARLGWTTLAHVELYCDGRVTGARIRRICEHHPEIEAAYTVAGEPSAVLSIRATDTAHLERVLEAVRAQEGVVRTASQVVLSTLFERPFRL